MPAAMEWLRKKRDYAAVEESCRQNRAANARRRNGNEKSANDVLAA